MKKYHVLLSNRKREVIYNFVGFIIFVTGFFLSIFTIQMLEWSKVIYFIIFAVFGFLYLLYVNLLLIDLRNCYLELDEKDLKILAKNEEVIIPYKEISAIELHKVNNLADYSNINLKLMSVDRRPYKLIFFSNKKEKPIDVVLTFLHTLNERVTYTLIDKTGFLR